MTVQLEPLFTKLTGLAPHFGRARDDIDAMVTRGRRGDYKGVMQNARLVLEAVLRALVTEELKQTPGKAMLDELVTKFRQQANAGVVPTNILAHMGTVQAWGNLSSHDHAGSLSDSAVKVGQDEVVASLNSMVAILSWYAERTGARLTPTASPNANRGGRALVIGGVAAAAIVAVAVGLFLRSPPASTASFDALDAVYAAWREPPPPPGCRRVEQAARLATVANDEPKLRLVDSTNPEAAFLLARATFEQRHERAGALDTALACAGFASASALAGRAALAANDLDAARKHYDTAIAAAPKFLKARVALAGILAKQGELEGALQQTNEVLGVDPDSGAALLLRASVHQVKGNTAQFATDICRAASLGVEEAKKPCAAVRSSP